MKGNMCGKWHNLILLGAGLIFGHIFSVGALGIYLKFVESLFRFF